MKIIQDEIKRIISILRNNKRFLITSHMDPDGDSIGSQLGIYYSLVNLAKDAAIINQGAIPAKYRFMDPRGIIGFEKKDLRFTPDTVFILECPALDRIGFVQDLIPDSAITINIDHHADNTNYAGINLVDAGSSAVGEMIYFLLKDGDFDITSEIAEELYAAIVSDTGRFRFESTTARAMRVASKLIEKGANPKSICDRLYSDFAPETMRLLGRALSSLRIEEDGKIGYLQITRKDVEESGGLMENSEGFVDFILSVSGVMLGFLFKEIDGDDVKVSVRSQDGFDAAAFARRFGGGGHVNAAGFICKGGITDVVRDILARATEFVNGR